LQNNEPQKILRSLFPDDRPATQKEAPLAVMKSSLRRGFSYLNRAGLNGKRLTFVL